MLQIPFLSLIVPTRGRVGRLRSFLNSLTTTISNAASIECILVIDQDDVATQSVTSNRLTLRQCIVPPGQTMGALNMAGYRAALGRYIMLLNDDVLCRTRAWDAQIKAVLESYPDDIALIHVNDTLMRTELCTFPLVSRTFCDIAGGICPTEYYRYRIDDHIEDIFNLLVQLGEQRTVYMPGVVFEHQNYEERISGNRQYFSDANVLAKDVPIFERLLPQRKQIALALMRHLHGHVSQGTIDAWRHRLDCISDSFAIRTPDRLRQLKSFSQRSLRSLRKRIRDRLPEPPIQYAWHEIICGKYRRARQCLRESGVRGLARTVWNRFFGRQSHQGNIKHSVDKITA